MKHGKFKSFILLFLILVMFVSVFSNDVDAYSLDPYKIVNKIHFIPYTGFGTTSISHFNEALYQWNYYAGKTLMTRDPSVRHSKTDYPKTDGKNYIYKLNIFSTAYVAESTIVYNTSTRVVVEADINFNMSYKFANLVANGSHIGCYDVWSVFIHEAGHVAGLDHSSYSAAVMYPSLIKSVLRRYPTDDDKRGIWAKYI